MRDTVYSNYKIVNHMDKLYEIAKGRKLIPPIVAQIDWTNSCNLNCKFCIYRNANMEVEGMTFDKSKSISRERGIKLIEELYDIGVKAIEHTGGGEPTLHENFFEFVDVARKLNLEQGLITNGTLLNKENVKHVADFEYVRFSVDAASRKTYMLVKGADKFNEVLTNIERLIQIKKKNNIVGFSFVVCRENYREIWDACNLAKALGCDNFRLSLAMTSEKEKIFIDIWEDIMKQVEEIKKLEDDKFKVFSFNNRIFDLSTCEEQNCIYTYLVAVITPTGCYPCCRLKDYEEFNFGSIIDKSFKDVWYGKKRINFLNDYAKRCRFNCWMREKNRFANYLINVINNEVLHKNFV